MASNATTTKSQTASKGERKLDETLAQTFPASDPPAANRFTGAEVHAESVKRPAENMPHSHDQAESDQLDEALEESFPASDPPAMTLKHGRDDAEPS